MPLRTKIALDDRNLKVVFVLLGDEKDFDTAPISGLFRVFEGDRKKNEDGVGAAFVDASDAVQLRTLGG